MNQTILSEHDDIRNAIEVLRRGGIILYPTDTVWGIGCDATNPAAVKRVFEIKQRSDSKALILLVGNEGTLQRFVENIPDIAWQLIDAAVNPLTIIYDKVVGIAPEAIAADGSAAFRITSERVSRRLCDSFRKPLVSTSANISGKPTPHIFSEISPEIINAVDYVMTTRRDDTTEANPSSIIKVSDGGLFKIIR
ncbi:MAG: L-threonylcarbamoyladenylate synthase [Muribaculaceae bacterium]|nr:L-threonylcarbamoyladenylate synthase [Muribaculaceae bacterium]